MISTNKFSEEVKSILFQIEKLASIESHHKFIVELDLCREKVNNC